MMNKIQPLHLTDLQFNWRLETLSHCPSYDYDMWKGKKVSQEAK